MTIEKRAQSPIQEIVLKEITFDTVTYVAPTWEEMGRYNFGLVKQITESGVTFDRIVALARGGWTWARDLADGLKIPELSSMRIKRYGGVNQSTEPIITQPLPDSIHGQTVLLFDEVIDEGVTVRKSQNYLREMGAKEVFIAALCFKPRSEVKPDYYAFQTSAWVVFPHEIREFVEESSARWEKNGQDLNGIKERLTQLGIPSEQIEFYLDTLQPRQG